MRLRSQRTDIAILPSRRRGWLGGPTAVNVLGDPSHGGIAPALCAGAVGVNVRGRGCGAGASFSL